MRRLEVEFAGLHALDEGIPFTTSISEGRLGGILGVTHHNGIAIHLYGHAETAGGIMHRP